MNQLRNDRIVQSLLQTTPGSAKMYLTSTLTTIPLTHTDLNYILDNLKPEHVFNNNDVKEFKDIISRRGRSKKQKRKKVKKTKRR